MKRIVLACALALPAVAQAKTITLYGDHAVCSRIPVIAQFVDTRGGRADWERRLTTEIRQGRCAVLPQGTVVTVDDQQGMFSCIRPEGIGACGWTVLHPGQLQ